MPDRSIWVCPSRYRRLSTASVARPLRQNSKPAIADNALFLGLLRASQVYICRKTFGYLLSRGQRTLCLCRERRSRHQGTRDAQAADEVAVEAAARACRYGNIARGDADEAGGGAITRAHGMASDGYRDGQGKFHVHLHAQPAEAAQGAATPRAVLAAHQPHRE